MSDQSDSQNKSEEQVQMSEGTSPSSSYDEGSRSTPSNLPKAATRTKKKRENAKAEKAAKMPSVEEASQVFLKSKQDQLAYLIQATSRIEKGLATLNKNQESLDWIIETKFYDLDLKVIEMQSAVEQL